MTNKIQYKKEMRSIVGTHILEIPANILVELQSALWRALGSPLPYDTFGEIEELTIRTVENYSVGFKVRRLEES